MAEALALGLVIGGAVAASVGKAFGDVEGRIKRLDNGIAKTKALQSMVGETKALQEEWRKAHTTGAATADGLRRKLEANIDVLKRQGLEVGNLGKAYQRLERQAKGAELKSLGQAQIRQGAAGLRNVAVGTAAAGAAMAVPARVSAEYNATVRDIAIKAGIANKPEEAQVSRKIIDTSRDSGMGRNEVADLVNALVGAGMELNKAMEYAPVAAKFVVGQGADGVDTAKMIMALGQNAKITDAAQMQKALEGIAFQGQAGSFEASDMAKWFPELLAGMGKLGISGTDSAAQLGAMLQVQMKTAGSSDEAANNLKNWMEKIGSGDVVKAYKDAGIDYQKSMDTGIANGKSTLETSFALAQKYVEQTDPKKAKQMNDAVGKISKETDPAKAKEMLNSLEQALRTGDLFADMQVKAALTAYSANKALYEQLKKDSGNAKGILDKNLAERRETSSQKWKEAGNAADDMLRSVGDALAPFTDAVATSITSVTQSLSGLAEESPRVIGGVVAVGGALAALASAYSTFKMARGVMNLGRGALMAAGNSVQKVQVVNAIPGLSGGGGGSAGGAGGRAGRGGAAGGEAGGSARGRRRWWGGRAGPTVPVMAPSEPVAPKPRMRVYSDGSAVAPKPGALSSWKPPTGAAGLAGGSASPVPARRINMGGEVKGSLPAELFGAALKAKDVYDSDGTRDEKAQGYGEAAGSMAGALAGAAAGAAIGSVVPVIGTAIGGMIGAYLGGMGGEALGGFAGKELFGSSDLAKAAPITPMLMGQAAPSPGPEIPSLSKFAAAYQAPVTGNGADGQVMAELMKKPDPQAPSMLLPAPSRASPSAAAMAASVEQSNTFSPVFNITVQGDAKDPQALANQLMPELKRQFEDLARQSARRSNVDESHS